MLLTSKYLSWDVRQHVWGGEQATGFGNSCSINGCCSAVLSDTEADSTVATVATYDDRRKKINATVAKGGSAWLRRNATSQR